MDIATSDLTHNLSKQKGAGILYLCTGKHGHLLRNSLASLKATNPNIPIFILADRPYDLTFQWVESWTGMASRQIKTQLGQYTPFELTLFVDYDTYFAKPIDLTEMLGEADMALALDSFPNLEEAMASRWWTQDAFRKEAREITSIYGRNQPFFNTGVMLWRNNFRTRQFFQCWHNEWSKYQKCDQFAFLRALKNANITIRTLPSSYNSHVFDSKKCEKEAHIYHLIEKERAAMNCGLWNPPPPGPFEAAFFKAVKKGLMAENQYQCVAREIYDHRPCNVLIVGNGCDIDLWSHCAEGKLLYVTEVGQSISILTENHFQFNFESQVGRWSQVTVPPNEVNRIWDYVIVQGPRGYDNSCPGRQIPIAWASKLARKAIFVFNYDRSWERKICDHYLGLADRVVDADGQTDRKLALFYITKPNSSTVFINSQQAVEIISETQPSISDPIPSKKSIHENLVVIRAGDTSMHQQWLAKDNMRNFDVYVSYYGDSIGKFKNDAEYYDHSIGLKWPILSKLYLENSDLFLSYDACWFPDDDLLISSESISKMFNIFHEYQLWLAQPSLAPGSYVTFAVTAQAIKTILRMSDFVEIMCPIFSRQTLSILAHTFSISASGWGLDSVWPKLLGYPRDRIAFIDETPVIHTRPLKTGSFYDQCYKMKVNPKEDLKRVLRRYKLKWRNPVIYDKLSLPGF